MSKLLYDIGATYAKPEFYSIEMEPSKEKTYLIGCIERQVRNQKSFKDYFKLLKTQDSFSKCVMSGSDHKLELHHYPFTLYDIVETVLNSCLNSGFTTFQISYMVIHLHFKLHIGLIPLSSLYHDMYHAGTLKLDPRLIRGNYVEFITQYSKFMSIPQLERIRDMDILPDNEIKKMLNVLKPRMVINRKANLAKLYQTSPLHNDV